MPHNGLKWTGLSESYRLYMYSIRIHSSVFLLCVIFIYLYESFAGVDESVVVVMKFSGNRMAFCTFSIAVRLPNDAVIAGTKGSIKVCYVGPVQEAFT